jgi:RHS repeat-associated protein
MKGTAVLGHVLMMLVLIVAATIRAHAETTTYAITDEQGTVVAQMDRAGNVTYEAGYRPYGLQTLGTPQAGPGYTGHVNDSDTGLVYMQARYYDPEVGRFLSVDPVTAYDTSDWRYLNRYAYAFNNPYRFSDPNGQAPCDWCDQAGFPKGDPVRTTGEALGALAAYAQGVATGDQALQQTALDGMRENVKPADGFNAAAMLVAPRGAKGEVGGLTAGRAAPDFVVTPRGEIIAVPSGATGPTPTRAPGVQFTGGQGGKGMDSRVTGVRVMEANPNQGPRAVYMNRTGQTVDPATGRTVPNADPRAHHYLGPWK